MGETTPRTTTQDDHFSNILSEFSKTFGSPSSKYPTVRCISRAALIRELVEILDRVSHPGTRRISGQALLEFLLRSGLVHRVSHIDSADNKSPAQFFSIGLNGSTPELDPIELLQAMVSQGIVCYFTAVQFHNLSTQIPTHHHIARISKSSSRPRIAPSISPIRRIPSTGAPRKRNRLGRQQFLYHGIPYYITNRESTRVPGIQQRHYTDKTVFSITTYEQTLLDTLERPLSCGGPSVVFEAWENAVGELDQKRILDHLRTIKDQRLTRRVGFMLHDHLQHKLDTDLRRYLYRIRSQHSKDQAAAMISLLPGYEFSHPNHGWGLEVP